MIRKNVLKNVILTKVHRLYQTAIGVSVLKKKKKKAKNHWKSHLKGWLHDFLEDFYVLFYFLKAKQTHLRKSKYLLLAFCVPILTLFP